MATPYQPRYARKRQRLRREDDDHREEEAVAYARSVVAEAESQDRARGWGGDWNRPGAFTIEVRRRLLQGYKDELDHRAAFLSTAEVWAFLDERLAVAREYHVDDALRHLVNDAAGVFRDGRMVQTGLRYHRLAGRALRGRG